MKKRILCVLVSMAVVMAYSVPSLAFSLEKEKSLSEETGLNMIADLIDNIFSGNDTLKISTDESSDQAISSIDYEMTEEEQFDEDKTIDLGICEGETSFTSDKTIEILSEEYNLGNPDDIDEIIYVPIVTPDVLTETTAVDAANNKYYIEKVDESEKKGNIIRSSWYEYPGGIMKIGNSLSRSYSYSAESGVSVDSEIVKAELKLKYGFNVTGTDYIEDTQKVTVKKGYKRNVKVYRNLAVYNYKLWKNRKLLKDKLCGTGKVKRPIGVIFTIGTNQKL